MQRFLLDTDTVSFALRGHGKVGGRIAQYPPSRLCVSAVSVAELLYGAEKRKSNKLRLLIERFKEEVTVVPFDSEAAGRYAWLASLLASRGTPIGPFDTLTGAHALALGMTLVTNNAKHFQRIPGLKTVNWI
jgi:tRNA(fMet)-specific endonuclease VapC